MLLNILNYVKKIKYIIAIVFIIIFLSLFVIFNNKSNIEDEKTEKEQRLLLKEKTSVKEKVKKESVNKETAKNIYVDVKGAVNNPGVYIMDENKRVIDAITKAGGLSKYAEAKPINMSKKLFDEMVIIVYTKAEIKACKEKPLIIAKAECEVEECICPEIKNDACIVINDSALKKDNKPIKEPEKSSDKVSINTATKEILQTLTGIGETKAIAIIEYRTANGPFKNIEELKNVSGIGESTFDKIKENITI